MEAIKMKDLLYKKLDMVLSTDFLKANIDYIPKVLELCDYACDQCYNEGMERVSDFILKNQRLFLDKYIQNYKNRIYNFDFDMHFDIIKGFSIESCKILSPIILDYFTKLDRNYSQIEVAEVLVKANPYYIDFILIRIEMNIRFVEFRLKEALKEFPEISTHEIIIKNNHSFDGFKKEFLNEMSLHGYQDNIITLEFIQEILKRPIELLQNQIGGYNQSKLVECFIGVIFSWERYRTLGKAFLQNNGINI
ncbi:MAG TPA: hypothetical protein VF941_06655 [Clostridia bacterium]